MKDYAETMRICDDVVLLIQNNIRDLNSGNVYNVYIKFITAVMNIII
jgi:hypothetical protein